MTLVSIPANPVPENVVTGTIKTPDGAELRFARWAPPLNRKGTVCVFQGRGEYMEKYFEVVRDLRRRGFAVAMIDWRGQGHSSRRLRDRRKGYVRDFADYEVDVETFMRGVVLPDCPPPFYALAHSMGSAVLLRVGISRDKEAWLGPIVGLLTGLVTAATGVFVIPAIVYMQGIGLEKEELVQALGLSFTVSTIALSFNLVGAGVLNISLAGTAIAALTAALAGMWIGQAVRLRLDQVTFRRWFFIGLLLLGIYLSGAPILRALT
jgi:pimeloyl-ACP methyl ester carboxylesterase